MAPELAAENGVTLEQYAGITAALADDFPLAGALAHEGLKPGAWKRADRAWKARIAVDGTEGALFQAYREKQIEAEDWLDRRVSPIDEDLGAWLGFLHAWSAHATPFELLAGAGLRLPDIARLQRRWSRRMEADEKLQQQATEIVRRGAGPMPAVAAAPGMLKPFPWSRPGAAAPEKGIETASGAGDALLELPLDRYAAMGAELAEPAADAPRILARQGLDAARFAILDALWKARLAADPALERDYRQLFEHQRARLGGRAAARSGGGLHGTSLALEAPRGPALPFVEASAAPAAATASSVPRPASTGLGGTSLAVNAPRGPATPFETGTPPALLDASPPAPNLPAPASNKLAGTSLALDVPRGPALPFVETGTAPAAATASPAAPGAPRPASTGLGGTSLALDVPRGLVMPFAGPAPRKAPNKLASVGVFKIPARLAAAPAPAAPPAPSPPRLTLEQYASLRVDLAMAPEKAAETLRRYQLTVPERESLDRHFQERLAREPGLREPWERACRTYREWLISRPRR